ncbi:glycoside hydrolase family 5 protein [uncultured Roseibium sp.]|uniref:glycoside hydrolase family 5 protein n=1 Tax=uncultured Roseibium sp. TaxID=1936171 RepID=UPI002598AD56|nr:glycoside hydrolase family 5 protein [uncultured Roseibium sp.]
MSQKSRFAFTAAFCLSLTVPPSSAIANCLRGINIAGGEFGDLPGKHGQTHIYPGTQTLDVFAAKGVNVVRLPFRWERLQPALLGPLDQTELTELNAAVDRATSRGMNVILDPHNYAGYGSGKIGSDQVSNADFADFWLRLAPHFANRSDVIYLLMNEPAGVAAAIWRDAANAAIKAIRDTGADNLIMVPGTIWTGASHWFEEQEGGANSEVLQEIKDPLNRFVFEVHQYLDDDFSGTNGACPRVDDAILALEGVSGWLRQHGFSGFLGEFGGTTASNCLTGLDEVAGYMASQSDIWLGWTAWAAGEWWGDYPYSLQPKDGLDPPQLSALVPYLSRTADASSHCTLLQKPVR